MTTPPITRTVELELTLTPTECAQAFALFSDSEQAEFFNQVAVCVEEEYEGPFVSQLQAVTDNPVLTPAGRIVMAQIGQYSESFPDSELGPEPEDGDLSETQ